MRTVSKAEFRKAQCSGALAGCEMVWGIHGADWVRDGRTVASQRHGFFGMNYYLVGSA